MGCFEFSGNGKGVLVFWDKRVLRADWHGNWSSFSFLFVKKC